MPSDYRSPEIIEIKPEGKDWLPFLIGPFHWIERYKEYKNDPAHKIEFVSPITYPIYQIASVAAVATGILAAYRIADAYVF